jgi:hypothetical protein
LKCALKDNFLKGRYKQIMKPSEEYECLMIAKMQLQIGLLKESEQTINNLMKKKPTPLEKIRLDYTLAKVFFMMNRYQESVNLYQ